MTNQAQDVECRRVLLVDDDEHLLAALVRRHRKAFDLVAACGPREGLERLDSEGPFAVVVSDYNMPEMDGVRFLEEVRRRAPETVRVMLTGNPGLEVAMGAVNSGAIFRFLTKPCDDETFRGCLEAAFEQHRLRQAERLLLERTLNGAIQVLCDVLALVNPGAFGRARRIREAACFLLDRFPVENRWCYETAALLSQLGMVALPPDLPARAAAGEELTEEERAQLERHPSVAGELLGRIPRLDEVARAIARQRDAFTNEQATLGDRIVAAAVELDRALAEGLDRGHALERLRRRGVEERFVDALRDFEPPEECTTVRTLSIDALRPGMILDEDLRHRTGALLVARGHEITETLLYRMRNLAGVGSVPEQVRVRVRVSGGVPLAPLGS